MDIIPRKSLKNNYNCKNDFIHIYSCVFYYVLQLIVIIYIFICHDKRNSYNI